MDVPVDHRQGRVPEGALEDEAVHAGGERPGGEGVREVVGMGVDAGCLAKAPHDELEATAGKGLVLAVGAA